MQILDKFLPQLEDLDEILIVFSLWVPTMSVMWEASFKLKVRFDAEQDLEFAIPTALSQTYYTHLLRLTSRIIEKTIQRGYSLCDEKEIMDLTFVFNDDLSGLIKDTIKLGQHCNDEVLGGLAISSHVFKKECENTAFVRECTIDKPLLQHWCQLSIVLIL